MDDVREMSNPVITVDNLTKKFGDFVAVDKLSFSVAEGEIFGFLGPNGAGKSTTIRMLCGVLSPSSGTGTVAGFDITTQSERIKECIGYMSQKFSLYEDLTVVENIDLYAGIYGVPETRMRERREWILDMANLRGREKNLTRELATGWKQRLALGCAIVHEPKILFLDEPTSGIDPISRRKFWNLIHEEVARGVTVLVTTHYMDDAEHCDRLAMIYHGRLIALGTPAKLKADYSSGKLLEVSATPIIQAMDVLYADPVVRDIGLFGKNLHAVVPDHEDTETYLCSLLENAGVSVESITTIVPSLEDVFIALVEEVDRANQQSSARGKGGKA